MRKLGSVAVILVAFLLCACTLHYYSKALLKYNPDRTIKDRFNNSALDYAVQYDFPAIAALLKEP